MSTDKKMKGMIHNILESIGRPSLWRKKSCLRLNGAIRMMERIIETMMKEKIRSLRKHGDIGLENESL